MSNYIATDTDLTAVADAIRTKGGTSAQLEFPGGFVDAIGAISTGPVSVPPSDVNFIDYDGTILYAYTAAEFAQLTEMPTNPSHEGLTAQGWNWSLTDAKTYVATYGKLWIGQMYTTTSGDTEIDIELHAPRLTPYLGFAVNGTVEVDWGDGTAKDVVTGTSLTTQIRTPHTYAAGDSYTIKIHKVSGSYTFYGSSTYSILSGDSSTKEKNFVYSNAVKNVRIGSSVTSIGASAFFYCFSLSAVTIPSGVTSIGNSAFYNCYSLSSVTIPSSVTSIGSAAFNSCSSLSAVTIPSGVTSIGNSAFYNCYSLSAVTIPSSVTGIGSSAFNYCSSLSAVTIPSGVTSIGGSAFNNCYGIGVIEFKSNTPPTVANSTAFTNVPTDCKIIVPYSADHSILNAYKTATNYPDPTVFTYEEAA